MDGLKARLGQWKYVLLVAAVGLALLLIPSGAEKEPGEAASEEARLEALLGRMEGVGEVQVLLSEKGAAVVCQGADNAVVRLGICEVLRCYAGLGTDRVRVFKMQ